MNKLRTTLVLAVAVCLSWVFAASLFATAKDAKDTGKACTFCHVKPVKGDENLNEVGKCFKEKKSLKDCEKK